MQAGLGLPVTAPIWMAFPPEVHSGMLSSGPGPGPLLASAAAWWSLGTEYASAAAELSTLVGGVQAGAWGGSAAQSYVATNSPYVAWLLQSAAKSTTMAAQQETAAAAYTVALAAMPTPGQLAANHATHAVLLATNFFGINTIPITINEAGYGRMWTQAATTMTVYQTVSTAAVAAAPVTPPAPQILKADAPVTSKSTAGEPGDPYPNPTNLSQVLADLAYDIKAAIAAFSGPIDPTTWAQLGQFISTTITNIANGIPQLLSSLAGNPSAFWVLLLWVLDFIAGRIFDVFVIVKFLLTQPLFYVVGLGVAVAYLGAAVGAAGGLAGLAGLAALPMNTEALSGALIPHPPVVGLSPVAATVATQAPAPAPAAAAPAPASVTESAPTAAPLPGTSPPVGPGGFPYLVGGLGMAFEMSTSAVSKKNAARTVAARVPTAAAVAGREQTRRRRRAKAEMLGRGYEYMDLEPDVVAEQDEWLASVATSSQGAGAIGTAATVGTADAAKAGGLATLAADTFGAGPRMPMMPRTWPTETD